MRLMHGPQCKDPSMCGGCTDLRDIKINFPVSAVDHPAHYGGDSTYETIKVIEAWALDFCLGNAVKYISRAGKKTPDLEQDLEKAVWYLQRRLKQIRDAKAPAKHLK